MLPQAIAYPKAFSPSFYETSVMCYATVDRCALFRRSENILQTRVETTASINTFFD